MAQGLPTRRGPCMMRREAAVDPIFSEDSLFLDVLWRRLTSPLAPEILIGFGAHPDLT
jgi:hypothetical protein